MVIKISKKYNIHITPIIVLQFIIIGMICITNCNNNNVITTVNYESEADTTNRGNFYINIDNKMIVNVGIDTLDYQFIFDSGASEKLILDVSIFNQLFNSNSLEQSMAKIGYGYEPDNLYSEDIIRINHPIKIKIGKAILSYNNFLVNNTLKKYNAHGIFSIPKDEKRIWNINFKNKFIEIKDSCALPKTLYSTDIYYENKYKIYLINNFPFKFMAENDSISFISDFMFDTGSPYDIVFLNGSSYTQPNIMKFLQDKSSWYEYKMQYNSGVIYNHKYYIKDNYMINDTINIMVQRAPGITTDIMGMGIIARFNWYINFNTGKIYIHKIPYIPAECKFMEQAKQLGLTTYYSRDGYLCVNAIYPFSYLYKAGLRGGDIIINIDNILSKEINPSYFRNKKVGEAIKIKIRRKGKELDITAIKTN